MQMQRRVDRAGEDGRGAYSPGPAGVGLGPGGQTDRQRKSTPGRGPVYVAAQRAGDTGDGVGLDCKIHMGLGFS